MRISTSLTSDLNATTVRLAIQIHVTQAKKHPSPKSENEAGQFIDIHNERDYRMCTPYLVSSGLMHMRPHKIKGERNERFSAPSLVPRRMVG